MRVLVTVCVAVVASCAFGGSGARAGSLNDPLTGLLASKADSLCFSRLYSAEHLARHPGQVTERAMLSFKQDGVRVMLQQTSQKQPLFLISSCQWSDQAGIDTSSKRMIPAFKKQSGFDCIVTVTRESAEEGGYQLIDPAQDAKSLVLHIDSPVAARLGLEQGGRRVDLKLGAQDREFLMTRTDRAACKPMEDALEGPN